MINSPRERADGSFAAAPWRWWAAEPRRLEWLSAARPLRRHARLRDQPGRLVHRRTDPGPGGPADLVARTWSAAPSSSSPATWRWSRSAAPGCPAGAGRDLGWWIVVVNQLGSVLFMVSAVASFVHHRRRRCSPSAIANWGTLDRRPVLCHRRGDAGVRAARGRPERMAAMAGDSAAERAPDRAGPAGDLAAAPAAAVAGGAARQRLGARAPATGSSSSTPASGGRGPAAPARPRARPRPASASRTSACVVCTHSHADHYGLAAPITERGRLRALDAPRLGARPADRRRPRRRARAADRGRPPERRPGGGAGALPRGARGATTRPGSTGIRVPDRDLLPGVEVETDHGTWQVHETPGHAPSHVVLHQPERRLMISGDHLLGRTVLFFDYGHTPDPVGEFLSSLTEVEPLEVDLCLPGHGRPFRDPEQQDRRGAAPGRGAARQGPRLARRGGADRLRDRRRVPRPREPRRARPAPGCCRSSSPSSTTWRSPARSSRSSGTDPQRWALT